MERKAYDQGQQLNSTPTAPKLVERVAPTFACPCCGESRMDWLAWNKAGTVVTCCKCSVDYDPCEV